MAFAIFDQVPHISGYVGITNSQNLENSDFVLL